MADESTAPAASPSPAAPAETPDSTPAEPISVPTEKKAYDEWRQTGKLPGDDKPSKEDSATSDKSVDDKSEKGAPASEAGKGKGRDNAESRIKQLIADRDSLKAKIEALESGKGASGDSPTAPDKHVKAAPSPAPELKRPDRPKQEDFDDWDSYEKAQDKYLEDLADFKAAGRLEEHTRKQRQQAATQEMQSRLDQAKERYGAEAEAKVTASAKTIFEDASVAPALKAAIGRSDVIVDALYVLGSDETELSGFLELSKTDPLEALRKWFTVEALVKEELKSNPAKGAAAGAPARGPDGKFLPPQQATPAKREAPSPPRELNGNATPTGDERERAAKTGDFRSFKSDADRRDMQRFRGQ